MLWWGVGLIVQMQYGVEATLLPAERPLLQLTLAQRNTPFDKRIIPPSEESGGKLTKGKRVQV